MRWIRCRKSALDPPSCAGGPRLVCPLAADRCGYRFFGQLFRTLRLAPDGDAMFPGTSGAEHAAREAGRANRSTRRKIMHIPNVLPQLADGIAPWTINRSDKHHAHDRKHTRLNYSHAYEYRMTSTA